MGKKYTGNGKYFLFFIAGAVIFLGFTGCSHLKNVFKSSTHLERANIFISNGDFTSALAENVSSIKDPLQIQTDLVIFQRGLIYGHPHNPNRDVNKAIQYFQQIVTQYPKSRLLTASKTLILILDESLIKDNQIEEHESAIRKYAERIDLQQKHLKELNKQIEDLKQQIEKYKTIDLNIEQKKKEKS